MNKKNLILRLVAPAASIIMLVAMSAAAGPTYDKGDLGKYERQGRYMKLVRTADHTHEAHSATRGVQKTGTVYDKGERGTFIRHGRYVHRVLQANEHSGHGGKAISEPAELRVVRHIKHIHRRPN